MLEHNYYYLGTKEQLKKLGFKKYTFSSNINYEFAVESKVKKDKFGISKKILGILEVDLATNELNIWNYSSLSDKEEFLQILEIIFNNLSKKNLLKKELKKK